MRRHQTAAQVMEKRAVQSEELLKIQSAQEEQLRQANEKLKER